MKINIGTMFNQNLYNLFKTILSSSMKRGPPILEKKDSKKKKEFLKNKTQNKYHSISTHPLLHFHWRDWKNKINKFKMITNNTITLFGRSTFAFPFSNKISTTCSCPLQAAIERGVTPSFTLKKNRKIKKQKKKKEKEERRGKKN